MRRDIYVTFKEISLDCLKCDMLSHIERYDFDLLETRTLYRCLKYNQYDCDKLMDQSFEKKDINDFCYDCSELQEIRHSNQDSTYVCEKYKEGRCNKLLKPKTVEVVEKETVDVVRSYVDLIKEEISKVYQLINHIENTRNNDCSDLFGDLNISYDDNSVSVQNICLNESSVSLNEVMTYIDTDKTNNANSLTIIINVKTGKEGPTNYYRVYKKYTKEDLNG